MLFSIVSLQLTIPRSEGLMKRTCAFAAYGSLPRFFNYLFICSGLVIYRRKSLCLHMVLHKRNKNFRRKKGSFACICMALAHQTSPLERNALLRNRISLFLAYTSRFEFMLLRTLPERFLMLFACNTLPILSRFVSQGKQTAVRLHAIRK